MKILSALLAAIFLGGCCMDLTKDKVRSEINKDLQIGDPREKVERVLKSRGIDFSYDGQFEQRYSSNIKGKNCAFDKSVILYIYLDKSGNVSRIETLDSYTFL